MEKTSDEYDKSWRHGPSKYWYDKYGIPENAVDYSAVMKAEEQNRHVNFEYHSPCSWNVPIKSVSECILSPNKKLTYPADALYLVSQIEWENDVIWDAAEVIKGKYKPKVFSAGCIPGIRINQ
ncbi:unnamed protein product [Orchesella dallaii]|uniref:Uncharacterized protein n=1 Tax=Orchesella dallaii TaxID=48710 RepID=A0ABP1S0C3_9HEXA